MAAHTLEFASKCEPGIPIDSIEVWETSTKEVIRSGPSTASLVACENHWSIVFKFDGYQVIATKHRGYDLNWHQFDFVLPSVRLKFEPLPSFPPMNDVAWEICSAENPDTKALECSSFE
ncbi:hypothetical protein KXV81_005490 [Aspergillus fumigatus]|nr:hypothetical protein KXX48_005952 [Aspergillus fumigatus]KAH1350434.1 hypothetical protein KXX63_003921 [Aspergillus fumigatus]KAH1383239.1 hypothetical protein KXX49_005563 [Aspergillus fumigatus]KAH1403059.1 hypothetical protein KXX51_001873 [Aspergillus fumigatus]KAH1439628.1 hypothetical protein KXX68_004606 [Aspergillus fumigatus]